MKNNILFALLAIVSACHPVYAEEAQTEVPTQGTYWAQKPVQCGPIDSLIEMVKEYGEEPALSANGLAMGIAGRGVDVKIVLGANEKTGTWTLIEIQSDGTMACVLGSGTGYELHKLPAGKLMTRG